MVELIQLIIHLMTKHKKNTFITYAFSFIVFAFFFHNAKSQVYVKDVKYLAKEGDTSFNERGYLLRVLKENREDSMKIILEYRINSKVVYTKYYAKYDSLHRLIYLNYITKRESVDGGGGKGIYIYKYQDSIPTELLVYKKSGRDYLFKYKEIYNLTLKKSFLYKTETKEDSLLLRSLQE